GRSAAGGVISAQVLALTKGALNTMAVTKWSLTALALLSVGGLATGTGTIAYYLLADEPAGSRLAAPLQTKAAKHEQGIGALQEFKKVYALGAGEDLKRVAPPYPISRTDYIRNLYPGAAKDARLPEFGSMYLRWDGAFHWLGAIMPRGGQLKYL